MNEVGRHMGHVKLENFCEWGKSRVMANPPIQEILYLSIYLCTFFTQILYTYVLST